jgi:Fe-S-cluster containining protein
MNSAPWYQEGIPFECAACGKCCITHQGYAFVYLARGDVQAISSFLGLSSAQLIAGYCLEEGNLYYLKSTTGDCLFLDQAGRCRIYPCRPMQCLTWPFWRENLVQEVWQREVAPRCPGVGQGPVHTAEEIERIAGQRENWYQGKSPQSS